jgi:peptide-methionine (S)-S-oxide reductase
MLFTRTPTALPSPDEAVPGRSEPIVVPGNHPVLGTPIGQPFPEGTEQAILGMGCFRGGDRPFGFVSP